MSHDIFVQDFPEGIQSVEAIPDDFEPGVVGKRSRILRTIQEIIPSVRFENEGWCSLDHPDLQLDINLGPCDGDLEGFSFHVRDGDASFTLICEILERLQLRALDPESDSGLFETAEYAESHPRWADYRDRVLKS